MIIDVNAYLGHYPFRSLKYTSAQKLTGLMDANGIDRAVVSSLHAVFYRNCHAGNLELAAEIRDFGQRFVPVATINPKYVGWRQDLEQCVKELGMKAVTLVPQHHGYSLGDEHGRAALEAIAEYDLPVVLTQRFEDRRQRHHWDVAEDLDAGSMLEAATAHPSLRFLLINWIGLDGSRLADAGLKGRCLLDFIRLHVVLLKDVPRLIASLGVESIAFGSHMPFDYVGPSLVKLSNLARLPEADLERIMWKNAAEFLRLKI